MARSAIPNPLDRRHLIEKDLSEAQALQLAEAYLAEGRMVESIEFLAKADARDKLAELRVAAVAAGDVFLLRAAARALGERPNRGEWTEVAAAAAAAGFELYVADAQRQIERDDSERDDSG